MIFKTELANFATLLYLFSYKNVMMKISNNTRSGKLMLITGLSLMLTVSAFAQENPDNDPDSTTVPFDGGISLLAAAGVAYGVKRWSDAKKNNASKELDSEA